MNMIWKTIEEYPNYMVNNIGEVKRKEGLDSAGHYRNEKMLSPKTNRYGYCEYALCKDGKMKSFTAHRLVAQAFIPNPHNYPCVNHKNEIKDDNRVENLEWCTIRYNTIYGTGLERARKNNPQCKKVIVDGKVFDSITLAYKYIGCHYKTLVHKLNNNITEYRGHKITYYN